MCVFAGGWVSGWVGVGVAWVWVWVWVCAYACTIRMVICSDFGL